MSKLTRYDIRHSKFLGKADAERNWTVVFASDVDALEQRVEELERLDTLTERLLCTAAQQRDEATAKLTDANALIERLYNALEEYGGHLAMCDRDIDKGRHCDCGLTEALSLTPTTEAPRRK